MRLGYAAGKVLAKTPPPARQPDGADRQGHPHFRLHAGSGAGSRLRRGRRRRDAGRPDADPGGRLPDARAAPVGRRGDFRVAQSVPGQRHQVLLRARQQAAGRGRARKSKKRSTSRWTAWRPDKLGSAKRLDDAQGRYIEFCKSTFPNELDLRGLKIVVDCAHGAAYHIAPHVFHELGAEVIAIGNKPDGFNINDGFGATAPKALVGRGARAQGRPRHRAGRRCRPPDHVSTQTAASTTATSCCT